MSLCSLATLDVLLAAVGYSALWSLLASALLVAGGLLVRRGALAAWLGLRWLPMLGVLRLASSLPCGLRAMLGVSLAAVVCSALWPPLRRRRASVRWSVVVDVKSAWLGLCWLPSLGVLTLAILLSVLMLGGLALLISSAL